MSNDNARFKELQEMPRTPEVREEMWQISYTLAGKWLTKECQKKGFFFDPETRHDLQMRICTDFMRRFEVPGYRVKKSVVVCVYDVLRNVLYHPTKADKAVSYVDSDVLSALAQKTRQLEFFEPPGALDDKQQSANRRKLLALKEQAIAIRQAAAEFVKLCDGVSDKEWHSLKANAEDLPPADKNTSSYSIDVLNEKSELCYYNYASGEWCESVSGNILNAPVAWRFKVIYGG